MSVGFYNPTDVVPAGANKPFPTARAMLDHWAAGLLTGVVCEEDPGHDGRLVGPVADTYLVALDTTITDRGFRDRNCAASPEQRDFLAALVGDAAATDLKLLTQQQYSEDQSCVDVYVTAVTQPSPFLAGLRQPVYLKNTGEHGTTFQAQAYPRTFNVAPVSAPLVELKLWER